MLTSMERHWVEKNCLPWTKEYFSKLKTTLSEAEGTTDQWIFSLDDVEVTGDVDLNQRKGKIIQIFDIAITLKWKGNQSIRDGFQKEFKLTAVIRCKPRIHRRVLS